MCEEEKVIFFKKRSKATKIYGDKTYAHCEVLHINSTSIPLTANIKLPNKIEIGIPIKNIIPRSECVCSECLLQKGGY